MRAQRNNPDSGLDTAARAPKPPARPGVQRAFTLVELLIVIAILSLLAAAAYPSYRGQVQKIRRNDAQRSLIQVAQQLERCYSRSRRYDQLDCPQVAAGPTISADSNDGYYRITSTSPGGAESLAAESFILYATPQGPQAGDRRCALFRYSSTSARAAFDASGQDVTADCW